MSVRRDVILSGVTAVVQTGSRFAVAAILARSLSRDLFGQFVYLQWLVDIGLLLASLGLNGAASRFFAEARHQPDIQGALVAWWRPRAFALAVLAGAGAALGVLASGLTISPWEFSGFVAWSLFNALWVLHVAALVGLQRFRAVLHSNVAVAVPMVAGMVLMSSRTAPLSVLLLVMVAATGFGAIIAAWPVRAAAQPGPLPLELDRRIRRYSVNVWLMALLAALVWSRGELPIVRLFLGDVGVGGYAPALTLLGGAIAAIMLGMRGAEPEMTRLLGAGDEARAVGLAGRLMAWQLVVGTGGALTLIWFAPELLHLAFGPDFRESAPLLGFLAIVVPCMCWTAHNHLLQIRTNASYNRNLAAAGVVLLFASTYLAVPPFGLIGAAVARAGTVATMGVVTLLVARRRWRIGSSSTLSFLASLAVCGAGAAVITARPDLGLEIRLAWFAGSTALALAAFAGLGILGRALPSSGREGNAGVAPQPGPQ